MFNSQKCKFFISFLSVLTLPQETKIIAPFKFFYYSFHLPVQIFSLAGREKQNDY